MHHAATILRQVRRASRQAGLYVLCVALAMASLTAFSGFARSVATALKTDARRLHAGDIVIRSYDPIAPALMRAVGRLAEAGRVERAMIHTFSSVVRSGDDGAAVFSRLKVVGSGYPFYGRVVLASGRDFGRVLAPGTAVVEQALLDRLGCAVGDPLKVGYTTLRIVDVVTAEPDRPLELFAVGPRVFIDAADLDALGLVATGSRVRRTVLLKVNDPAQVGPIAERLKRDFGDDRTQVDTYLTAPSAVKRFLDNFLFFLKLVGLFILIVAGLGIQSTLSAFFNEKRTTIAIMKAVGATGRFVVVHFLLLVCVLGAAGGVLGIAGGMAVQAGLTELVRPFLPEQMTLAPSWLGIVEAVVLGLIVTALFSLLPLYRLREMRPAAIFSRQPPTRTRSGAVVGVGLLTAAFFVLLVLWHMRDLRFGIHFVGGMTAVILAAALLAQLMLWGIKHLPVRHLALRQAIRGLFRRGNATRAVMITLTVSLSVIFGELLIERNLNATFVRSFPDDLPNAYFIDIQPSQTRAFAETVGTAVQFYPIVRARVTAVNDAPIEGRRGDRPRGDRMTRVFNLTYRDNLLADERLVEGDALFRDDWPALQVSVMDRVTEMQAMTIGDRIRFDIQGVPLTARVSSIRTRDERSLSPFFYFVFPPAVLEKAPQTLFAALNVPPGQVGRLQRTVAARFPNISLLDLSQILRTLAGLMARMAQVLRLFSLFSVAAGLLILVSAVFATRAERMVESVYFKILGAGRGFVLGVFALENLLIGLLGGTLALLMAQAGAWWVCAHRFDIAYQPFLPLSLGMVGVTALLTVVVGLGASRSIVTKKPVVYLREQQNG